MDLLTKLAESIPERYRTLTLALMVAAYFLIPYVRERITNSNYWDFREKELRILSLVSELAKLSPATYSEISSGLRTELRAQGVLLRPDFRPHIQRSTFLTASFAGAAVVLTAISMIAVASQKVSFLDAMLFSAAPQMAVALFFLVTMKARSSLAAFSVGACTGLFVHILLILFNEVAA